MMVLRSVPEPGWLPDENIVRPPGDGRMSSHHSIRRFVGGE
jgi:hypothetical protein